MCKLWDILINLEVTIGDENHEIQNEIVKLDIIYFVAVDRRKGGRGPIHLSIYIHLCPFRGRSKIVDGKLQTSYQITSALINFLGRQINFVAQQMTTFQSHSNDHIGEQEPKCYKIMKFACLQKNPDNTVTS